MSLSTPTSRQQLRQYIRQQRMALSQQQQQKAAQDLLTQVQHLPEIHHAKQVAIYFSADGEINTRPLIEWLWQQGKKVVLPVLHPFSQGHLLFLYYQKDTPLIINRYGISEPQLDQTQICLLHDIDIIFTPLVAFDASGQRLGMGGGYYDRTFALCAQLVKPPIAIGLAHHCQEVDQIPTESWDVPLPIIVTPNRIWHWEKNDKSL